MQNKLLEKYGPWALITGASSGIGAEFARQLAHKGFNLILVARRVERLKHIKKEITDNNPVDIVLVPLDLSEPNFHTALHPYIENIDIGLLVNNAGFSLLGPFLDNPLEREIELFQVNCRAPLILAHELGKNMRARKKSGIIFVSSIASMTPSPPWTGYAASKAYTKVLGECLAYELKPDHIDTLVLCPGGTNTEFQQVAGADSKQAGFLTRLVITEMSPQSVVHTGLSHLGKTSIVIPGWRNYFMMKSAHFLPQNITIALTNWVLNKMQKEKS